METYNADVATLVHWGWMGPGGSRGLQNRCTGACASAGGFDSHTLPPDHRCLCRNCPNTWANRVVNPNRATMEMHHGNLVC